MEAPAAAALDTGKAQSANTNQPQPVGMQADVLDFWVG